MKFSILKEHVEFFQKNGWVEFESCLSAHQVDSFNAAIDRALASRALAEHRTLSRLSTDENFAYGRDLWRADPELSRWTCHRKWGEIVFELLKKKPLRLGFDQLITMSSGSKLSAYSMSSKFLEQMTPLENITPIQGLVCGLILSLNQTEREGAFPPPALGSGIFFTPQTVLPLHLWKGETGCRFYLIAYTDSISYYQPQVGDLAADKLKQLGYIIQDKLIDKFHPIIYR